MLLIAPVPLMCDAQSNHCKAICADRPLYNGHVCAAGSCGEPRTFGSECQFETYVCNNVATGKRTLHITI